MTEIKDVSAKSRGHGRGVFGVARTIWDHPIFKAAMPTTWPMQSLIAESLTRLM